MLSAWMENLGGKKKKLVCTSQSGQDNLSLIRQVCFLNFLVFNGLEIEFEGSKGARLFEIKAAFLVFK